MGLLSRKKKQDKKEEISKKEEVVVKVDETKKEAPEQKIKGGSIRSNKVIIKPLITEKAAIAQSLNKYMFIVANDASVYEVKRAIKEIYSVNPIKVNLINVQGKTKRFGRTKGRTKDFKKAIITLEKGKSIAIHEGV